MVASARFHPYEYAYYNPLVKPQGLFELDYWGTSFREVAEQLNAYGRRHGGGKLALAVCGPPHTLAPFLDSKRFEIVPPDSSAKKLIVALNRFGCISEVTQEPLMTVKRGESVLAEVGSN